MVRKIFSKIFRQFLFCHDGISSNSRRTSIFFSPHPDDETLGCGGTIAKKCQSGEHVIVVLMTDGSRSHPELISTDKLKSIRKKEFFAATNILGVDRNNIIILDFQDGELSHHKNEAINVVKKLLKKTNPDQIFVPYLRENPEDHYMTSEIVLSAMKTISRSCEIYEYPIWFWNQWPYCNFVFKGYKKLPTQIFNTLKSNINMYMDFRVANEINGFLEIKIEALEKYTSQMTNMVDNKRWRTLVDVSSGEFIKCFKENYEIFRLTKYG